MDDFEMLLQEIFTLNNSFNEDDSFMNSTLYERNPDKIMRSVSKLIKKRYLIFGYISFANYIRDKITSPSTLPDSDKEQYKKDQIRKIFSGKLLVIDEAHNLRDVKIHEESAFDDVGQDDASAGKSLSQYLPDVLRYSEGMKFCTLTATPMYNSYK
jgi:hypothetical protein